MQDFSFHLKCIKFYFVWGSAPDPSNGAFCAPQTPQLGLAKETEKDGRGRKVERKNEGEERGREGGKSKAESKGERKGERKGSGEEGKVKGTGPRD